TTTRPRPRSAADRRRAQLFTRETPHPRTFPMTTVTLLMIACAVLAIALIQILNQLRKAQRKLELVRQITLENAGYVPDDLLGQPGGKTFQRASGYWSRVLVR